jgi:hypothetical protein
MLDPRPKMDHVSVELDSVGRSFSGLPRLVPCKFRRVSGNAKWGAIQSMIRRTGDKLTVIA